MKTLRDIGELEVVARLCRHLPEHARLAVGAGDDCAVVRLAPGAGEDWVLTSDAVIENVHFRPEAPPRAIGHKGVGRVLSDLAAMGSEPRWGLINVVAPPAMSVARLEGVYAGAMALAGKHGLVVAGGDVASGPCLELHLFGVGAVPCGKAVLRSTAKVGDRLFVTGSLGGSSRGRHLRVAPRVREGLWLRDRASAMIDLSDGLATDLRHVTEGSGVGCRLHCDALPVARAAREMGDAPAPWEHALWDGEDYELLFTIPEDEVEAFRAAWSDRFSLPCTCIGRMTEGPPDIRCVFADGSSQGLDRPAYAHFGDR